MLEKAEPRALNAAVPRLAPPPGVQHFDLTSNDEDLL